MFPDLPSTIPETFIQIDTAMSEEITYEERDSPPPWNPNTKSLLALISFNLSDFCLDTFITFIITWHTTVTSALKGVTNTVILAAHKGTKAWSWRFDAGVGQEQVMKRQSQVQGQLLEKVA